MITPEQKAHFHDFGFVRLRQQFSAEEMETLSREVYKLFEEQQGGGPPSGQNQGIDDIVEKGEVMTRMVADDRIFGTVEELLGPGFVWNGSAGSFQFTTTQSHWHSDRPTEPHATTINLNIYLDKLRADTGALRVIPGSHKPALYDDLLPLSEQADETPQKVYGLDQTDIPGFAIESDPGDLVFFTQKTYHSVFGMQPGRRYLKLRFAARLETDEQIASFMRYDNRGSIYQAQDAFANSDNPRIRAMVDPLLELRARTEAEREHFDALGAREMSIDRLLSALGVTTLPRSSDSYKNLNRSSKYQGRM